MLRSLFLTVLMEIRWWCLLMLPSLYLTLLMLLNSPYVSLSLPYSANGDSLMMPPYASLSFPSVLMLLNSPYASLSFPYSANGDSMMMPPYASLSPRLGGNKITLNSRFTKKLGKIQVSFGMAAFIFQVWCPISGIMAYLWYLMASVWYDVSIHV